MTLSIETLTIMTNNVMPSVVYAEGPDFYFVICNVIMLSIVMLSVVASQALTAMLVQSLWRMSNKIKGL
jgi:hypothetical protein